ncbi:unnamed protein product [Brassica oleracea]
MSGVGVIVSDPWLQSQLTQVELCSLYSKFAALKNQRDKVTLKDTPVLVKVKSLTSTFKEKEIIEILPDLASDYAAYDDLDFESFLKQFVGRLMNEPSTR